MELSRYIPVDYNDDEHLYSLGAERYLSATQVVEKFCNPFPEDAHIKYAEKHGNTPEYWKEQWEITKQLSLVRGNRIHDSNELVDHGRMLDFYKGQQLNVIGGAVIDDDPWINRPDGVYTERKLWHHGYRIAGRADKIILLTNHETGQRFAHVVDYKTNRKLDKESYQFKNGTYKMMRPPLGHIMDSNWWHYQLQLSLYMFMLEYQGFTPGEMGIIHYPHEGDKETHAVQYLKREVLKMLSYLRAA